MVLEISREKKPKKVLLKKGGREKKNAAIPTIHRREKAR